MNVYIKKVSFLSNNLKLISLSFSNKKFKICNTLNILNFWHFISFLYTFKILKFHISKYFKYIVL